MTVTTPLGLVLRDDEGVRLEFVRTYDDPVEDVWSALTDPERTARWIGRWSGDPTTGTVDFFMVEDESGTPQPVGIVRCERPTLLELDMTGPEGIWNLTVVLSEAAGTTTLTFTHRLAEPYDASDIGPGWHYYLDRFGAVLAGTDVPDVWDDYYPTLAGDYGLPDGET